MEGKNSKQAFYSYSLLLPHYIHKPVSCPEIQFSFRTWNIRSWKYCRKVSNI